MVAFHFSEMLSRLNSPREEVSSRTPRRPEPVPTTLLGWMRVHPFDVGLDCPQRPSTTGDLSMMNLLRAEEALPPDSIRWMNGAWMNPSRGSVAISEPTCLAPLQSEAASRHFLPICRLGELKEWRRPLWRRSRRYANMC